MYVYSRMGFGIDKHPIAAMECLIHLSADGRLSKNQYCLECYQNAYIS